MADNEIQGYNNQPSNDFESLDLQKIYVQLSTSDNTNFDGINEERFVMQCINECFDKEFLMINSDELLSNANKLNVKFVELIKFCRDKKFIKVHIIFCVYCDYFNLPITIVYQNFHEKLQNLIKMGYRKMVGESTWKNMMIKFSQKPSGQPSLFDLFGYK